MFSEHYRKSTTMETACLCFELSRKNFKYKSTLITREMLLVFNFSRDMFAQILIKITHNNALGNCELHLNLNFKSFIKLLNISQN